MIVKLKNLFIPQETSAVTQEELLASFKAHYLRENEFVRTSIYWMVRGDGPTLDDLVQETFVKAWKAYPKFKGDSNFRTWIYRIAMNTTYDYLRKNQPITDSEVDSLEAKNSSPELKDLITKGLAQLNEKHREVFILFYKMEYKVAEIAELLELPAGTVKSRLFKARETFQEFLKKNEVDGARYE